ncbi:sodium- and chloride-dependent glycine transporter 1-like [Mytilus edulis]|uniref:sodium- and chloride-dependent glycine transporter 1-like n=1 Tax=Mytilus edulis TaxID=6550 RepID=UPI0039F11852
MKMEEVVYFTATFPYVILLILLIRGATLDGAIDGVKYFLIPEWSKLSDLKVWVAAAGQMFFSLSVSFDGIIMFGSYNKFSNNAYGDALLIAVMDLVTSIIAGFVIFTSFGALAKKTGLEVSEVARGGYGLAFVAYPEALSNLPLPQLWSVLFFFMLFTLGLDSEFALLETVLKI